MDILEKLKEERAKKKAELAEIDNALTLIYRERQATCNHPDKKSDPYTHWCDYCGWYKDRSF